MLFCYAVAECFTKVAETNFPVVNCFPKFLPYCKIFITLVCFIYSEVSNVSWLQIKVEEFFNLYFSDNAVNFIESFHRRCGDKGSLL